MKLLRNPPLRGESGNRVPAPSGRFVLACVAAAILVSAWAAGCAKAPRPRLFVIGLDGATWDLIGPWIENGDLPNLKALRDQSAWGTMRSVIPYLSPPAWTTAITGVNPGRHGIFDFQRRLPQSNKVVTETSKSRRSPPIWNMLKGSGLRVAVVNVPMTDPPDDVDGVMVAGFPHLDQKGYAWPRALEDTLKTMGYLTDKMEMKIPEGEEEAVFQELWNTMEKRWELVRKLYTQARYDLFWVVFTQTDRVQHLFWKFDDPKSPHYVPEQAAKFGGSMKKLWVEQDRILGELLKLLPPDTWVLVLSDHGFGPIRREFRVGCYLRRPESGFTEEDAENVFCLDRSDAARLYIREPGRDPGGTLDADARKALEAKLVSKLRGLRDPSTGEEVIEEVYPKEKVFVGKYAERGPTLTLMPARGWHITFGDVEDGFKLAPFGDLSTGLSGWHRMNGMFILRGPGVRPGHVEKEYNLLDVVPTCMYILQQTMAEDLDGKIMEDCFTPEHLRKVSPKRTGRLTEEDRPMTPEEIESLRNLPYIGG